MKPGFICVGAQKAGTTTLHDIFRQHPDIYLPKLKEAHFFDQEERYKKGIDWWLNTFFKDYKDEKITGVMTPEYLYYEEVPARIAETLGKDVKIIIVLRNPADRAYSHYLMSRRRGFELLSFKEAIENEPERIKLGAFERNHFSYIDRGYYSKQVERYLNLFGKENVLILFFEKDIVRNIKMTVMKVERFLGVSEHLLNTDLKSNTASEPKFQLVNRFIYGDNLLKKMIRPFMRSLTLKVRILQFIDRMNQTSGTMKQWSDKDRKEIICKYYSNEKKQLEELLGCDLSGWW